jgi:hypothetical protein
MNSWRTLCAQNALPVERPEHVDISHMAFPCALLLTPILPYTRNANPC